MPIGLSSGAYYEDELDYKLASFKTPVTTPSVIGDNKAVFDSPEFDTFKRGVEDIDLTNQVRERFGTHEKNFQETIEHFGSKNFVQPIADKKGVGVPSTPLSPEDHKTLMWDTPFVSRKDPFWKEGTSKERLDAVEELLNHDEQHHIDRYNSINKALKDTFGKGSGVLGDPTPPHRLRFSPGHPMRKELLEHPIPDTMIHEMEDGSLIIRKTPKPGPPLVSENESLVHKASMKRNDPSDPVKPGRGTDVGGGPPARLNRAANDNKELHPSQGKDPFQLPMSPEAERRLTQSLHDLDTKKTLELRDTLRDRLKEFINKSPKVMTNRQVEDIRILKDMLQRTENLLK